MRRTNAARGATGGSGSPSGAVGGVVQLAVLALMATGLTVSTAPSASALDVGCGDTITVSTTLERDLEDCPDNGLIVGADDIVLDLNGHTIYGDAVTAATCPEEVACDVGVDNGAGHRGVTVTGGAIRDFALGVRIIDAVDNELVRLRVSDIEYVGVLLVGSRGARVERSSIKRNGLTTDQAGLVVVGSPDSSIVGSTVSGNGDIGLLLQEADGSRITGNRFTDNPEAGVVVEATGVHVARNVLVNDGDGIILAGDDNVVTANLVSKAKGCVDDGQPACGFGISLEGGSRNLVSTNVVAGARRGGVRVEAFAGATRDNVVRGNLVRAAGADGIQVDHEGAGVVDSTVLDRNMSSRAGDDGIDVRSRTTVLSRNVAIRNGALGIRAVIGVSDRGGNRAFRNGDRRQCLLITCRP